MNKEKFLLKEKEKENEIYLTRFIKMCIDKENRVIKSNACNKLYNYIQIYYSEFKKN